MVGSQGDVKIVSGEEFYKELMKDNEESTEETPSEENQETETEENEEENETDKGSKELSEEEILSLTESLKNLSQSLKGVI